MASCPNCHRTVDLRYRVCGYCRAQLVANRPPQEVRRKVTIVTSDLKGSTSLGEKLDPESLREVLTLYFDEMRAVFESHGGTIEKIIGDAIVAVFGLPLPREGDALRALSAAAESQRALAALNEQLQRTWGVELNNRTGIATGRAIIGEASAGEHILTGDVMQLANKLEQSAPVNEVLVGAPTLMEVGDDIEVEAVDPVLPKGATDPVAAYRLVCVNTDAEVLAPLSTPGGLSGARICPNCGEDNPEAFTYCGACGGGLAGQVRVQESRKTVTIVFSDLKATTLDGEALIPERLRDVMATAFAEARHVIEKHGGTVEKFIGDAVMAVFGLPVRHEDDGLRAVRSALDMKASLATLAESLARDQAIRLDVAIGVNTGEVVAGDASLGQRLVTGDAVNVAARLEQAAPRHEVLIGDLTYGLVRDAVDVEEVEPLTLKGKARPVPAYRLIAVRSGDAVARRQDAPMVGREREMAQLDEMLTASIRERRARMVTLVGDAGVGKTRLTKEFLDSVRGRARVIRGRCLPYGDGITFWPIVEVVREAANIRDGDPPESARGRLVSLLGHDGEDVAERVASAVGLLDTPFPVSELFWGIRKFLEVLAHDGPVVVHIDDIHWAEATFLDLIGYLTDTSEDGAVLLLCTARNELLERHAGWAQDSRQARIVLAPLSDADAGLVVENLLGQAGLAQSVRTRVVAAAEGNPLFVEQLLSMLIDNRSLRFADGRWAPAVDLSDISIPPTIHALLASRLDQLPPLERSVVEPASVIGLSFAPSAVWELAPDDVKADLWTHLSSLAAKQLVKAGQAESESDPSYRFQHILIKDAAYQGLLKRSRAIFHERFVIWADRVNADAGRTTEFEEILGWHLEQAHRYRKDLGPLDEHGIAVGIDASRRLSSAGRRAMARGDMPAAASLLRRAASLVLEDHQTRPRLLRDAGEALMELGEFTAADEALVAARAGAAALADGGMETTATIMRMQLRFYQTGSADGGTDAISEVQALLPVLEADANHDGLARAWRLLTMIGFGIGRYVFTENAAERAIEHARLAEDRLIETRSRSSLAMCALLGQTPVPQAIERCEELLVQAEGDRKSESLILAVLAHLEAMRGETGRARDLYRRSRATLEELGVKLLAALTSLDSGWVEMIAGDPVAAERELRGDYETLNAMGERMYISTTSASLSEALYRQGRYDEAEAMTTFSQEIAAPDDVSTQFLWRHVRAKVLARRGDCDEAVTLATESVRVIGESDDIESQGNALMSLAEVFCLCGRRREATDAAEQARERFQRKGNVVSATLATSFRQSLEAGLPSAIVLEPLHFRPAIQ
ncbi:MAG: adenylate/guanylate cyclase domain-containing protein [Candidatus Limnocylindrales bacterium]